MAPDNGMDEQTPETFFNGRITMFQPASGYRFSMDAVILADAAARSKAFRAADIGTGCGILPIVMAYRNPEISVIHGIEIQGELAELARKNVSINHMDPRIRIHTKDIKQVTTRQLGGPVDLIACNPPHYETGAGRINPVSQKALARHEIALTLEGLVSAASRLLVSGGALLVIYPASRLIDICWNMRNTGIEPKWIRFIHSAPDRAASRVLVKGVKDGGAGVAVAHPLYVADGDGRYTPEMKAMFDP